ncbi:GNAT family N-acetyltransferase [Anaerocolumna sp. MB42-C2]|uniref:GNAT family N-acetyltransferase n=1 Tax=Anaerocolumna sp. MB42-C2 TaxID=3070997 RepID=UPI0027DFD445|nr:GNAT family protein [Anaerocolumna sp. MB42-C2]WMJ89873.1 GNAT family protein [Anaerocolumna sp. MB42-C2]
MINKDGLHIIKAGPEDAEAIIEYLNIIGGESDNLLFGKGEFNLSVKQEQSFISGINNSANSIMLLGKVNGEIVSVSSLSGYSKARIAHRGEIAISVKKSFWGQGFGTAMMKELIKFGKETAKLEVIQLEVKSDNEKAIHLYENLGFVKIGTYKKFFKINNKYYDAYLMNLYL